MTWILKELGIMQDANEKGQSELDLDAALAQVHTEGMRVKPKKLQTRIPQEVLEPILQATHTKNGRRQIMQHLEECFRKPLENSNWRQIHSALVIASEAMLNGSELILEEIADGRRFNPLQQISLLSHYKMDDIGVESQELVRSKASALQDELLSRLQPLIQAHEAAKLVTKGAYPQTKAPLTTTTSPYQEAGLLTNILREVGFAQSDDQPMQSEIELAEALAYIPTIDIQPKSLRTIIPQEHLQKVSAGTYTEKGRQMIMQHLRSFLSSDVEGWRPVYAAIVIAHEAMLKGSSVLLQEIVEGHHFDPLQRLILLEKYESGESDGNARAARNLICQKARDLRNELGERLQESAVQNDEQSNAVTSSSVQKPFKSELELAEALEYISTADVQPKNMRTRIPQEHLQKVINGTYTEKGRQMIMEHLDRDLQSNISVQPAGAHAACHGHSSPGIVNGLLATASDAANQAQALPDWRPVYAALVIASEALGLEGSPILLQDIAKGHHFDLLQRLVLLEKYESGEDDRNARAATNLICQKAQELHVKIAPQLKAPTVESEKKPTESAPTVDSEEKPTESVAVPCEEEPLDTAGVTEASLVAASAGEAPPAEASAEETPPAEVSAEETLPAEASAEETPPAEGSGAAAKCNDEAPQATKEDKELWEGSAADTLG